MSLLKIDNLVVHFETKPLVKAVDGISLEINKGEIVALVGESGSGKSVTALSILRLVSEPGKIKSGGIAFKQQELLQLSPKQMRAVRGREISLILQDPLSALNPLFKSGEQIAEVMRYHFKLSKKKATTRAKELMHKVRISDVDRVYDAYPHELSGGLRQRILIAAALAAEPSLLIANEPTTALDTTIQKQILELLKQLGEDFDLSILLITHDLGIVSEIADRVYVMKAGRIVEFAETIDLFESPQQDYTRALLEATPKIKTSNNTS